MNIYKCSNICSQCDTACSLCSYCQEDCCPCQCPCDCCCNNANDTPCVFALVNPNVQCLIDRDTLKFTNSFINLGNCVIHHDNCDEIDFIVPGTYKVMYSVSVASGDEIFPKTATLALRLNNRLVDYSIETTTLTCGAKVKVLNREVTVTVKTPSALTLESIGTNLIYSNALLNIERIEC